MGLKASKIIADYTCGDLFGTSQVVIDDSENDDNSTPPKNRIEFLIDSPGETDFPKNPINLKPEIQKILSINSDEGLFKYFVDGTRKTYKVSSIEYDKKVYPIIAGQIAVGCCERKNKNICAVKYYHENLISLPQIAYADFDETGKKRAGFFNEIKNQINDSTLFKRMNICIDHIIPYKQEKHVSQEIPYENLGIAAIHEMMLDREKKIVNDLANENNLSCLENYLIKDGSIEYIDSKRGEFRDLGKIKNNYKRVVGVSKTFNPDQSSSGKKSNASMIAGLPEFYRTPAFKFYGTRSNSKTKTPLYFVAWYVRIRKYLGNNPFDGILKVEKLLLGDNPRDEYLDSQEIDMISANLILERLPTSFGKEGRWANHLYPVYLTEKFIKNIQINDYVFTNLF